MKNNFNIVLVGDTKAAISSDELAALVDISMVCPKTSSMINKETKDCSVIIKNTSDANCCDFNRASTDIRNNTELRALGVSDLSYAICSSIKDHPNKFLSSGLNGYVMQAIGQPCLYLKHDTQNVKIDRVGFSDFTEIRQRLIHKANVESESKFITKDKILSGVVGVLLSASVFALSKFNK